MKKLLSYLLILLMMLSVVFVTVSCNNEAKNDPTPTPQVEDNTQGQKCDPILPRGTGKAVPRWEGVGEGGVTGLADFVTDGSKTNVTEQLIAAVENAKQSDFAATPKRVIYIIGDGMGQKQLVASKEYKGDIILDHLPYKTQANTKCYLSFEDSDEGTDKTSLTTTDSPAGGTQLLSGYKTRYGYISLDINGKSVPNLTEVAKKNGWKTATVTNDHIADATPACSLVHNTLRYHQEVLYYQELMEDMPDLLMGWDWGMSYFFDSKNWAAGLLAAEEAAISRAYGKNKKTLPARAGKTPAAYYESLTDTQKAIFEPYSLYYHIWSTKTDKSVAFIDWVKNDDGLKVYCDELDATFKPSEKVFRRETFGEIVANKDFSKPILGSWTDDGPDYDSKNPCRGYLLESEDWPNFSEMVAYTLYQMDTMVKQDSESDGFFCMIENTCTDGWGHCENKYKQKVPGFLNEIQCFDEGVAIAVKYVLEHPDTLLVVSADHDTGNLKMGDGWENDFSQIKANSTNHTANPVPCIAFGAGADKFAASAIGELHEGCFTGQVLGRLMGDENFGQPDDYPN